jgi:hypothetical protein
VVAVLLVLAGHGDLLAGLHVLELTYGLTHHGRGRGLPVVRLDRDRLRVHVHGDNLGGHVVVLRLVIVTLAGDRRDGGHDEREDQNEQRGLPHQDSSFA